VNDRVTHVQKWLVPAALYTVLSLALTYPLIIRAGSTLPHDAGDPTLNTWLLWWSTTRLPLSAEWWNAPMFYPMRGAMALSELLIGLLPITAPVQWATGNPVLAYNAAFVASFPLCGLAVYLLAVELTGRRDASIVAGLVFAFGPYRMNELAHIQMLSYYWAPVALWALTRHGRDGRPVWLAVFAAAWLLQSLSNGYAMFHVSVLVALWIAWFVRDIRKIAPIAAAWVLGALPLAPALFAYRAAHAQLHLTRDINEIQKLSADVAAVLSAPPELALWGGRLLPSQSSTALFPGVTVALVLVLGALGYVRRRQPAPVVWSRLRMVVAAAAAACVAVASSAAIFGPWSVGPLTVSNVHKPFSLAVVSSVVVFAMSDAWRRAWRERSTLAFYALAAALMYLLALGPAPSLFGRQVLYEPPYAWLMRLPGFDVLRVPARFGMVFLLSQAVMVALVLARWSPRLPMRRLAIAAVGAAVLTEGWVWLPVMAAPVAPDAPFQALAASGARAIVELPPGEPIVDFPALYHGMSHRLPVANGFSGFAPPHYLPLIQAINRGHYAVLEEMAAFGPIGVAIDRSLPWHGDTELSVSRLPAARRVTTDERWATFLVSGSPRPGVELGPRVAVARIRANRRDGNTARMMDGRVESAWGPETPQDGLEEVTVDLDGPHVVGAVVLEMGAYSFGFPRELAIEASLDGASWQTLWQDDVSVITVRAALADPGRVPVTIVFQPMRAAFLRLRQLGRDPTVPWWIAELSIRAR
jgi:hypothetical protein